MASKAVRMGLMLLHWEQTEKDGTHRLRQEMTSGEREPKRMWKIHT